MVESCSVCLAAPVPPPYGGISNWTRMVKKHFDGNPGLGITLSIVDTAPKNRDVDGRSIFDRVFGGVKGLLESRRQLIKYCCENPDSVVHITSSGSLGLFRDCELLKVCRKYDVRSIIQFRFGRIPEVLDTGIIEKRLLLRVLHLADGILVLDSDSKAAIEKCGFRADCIPNPIEVDESLECFSDNLDVCFLGWVIRTKGIEELLEAWSRLSDFSQEKDSFLKIVGPYDQCYVDYLKSQFPLNNVEFYGELAHEEALKLLRETGIFVLPSYTEGFPNAVLEAMASGCAVIATSVGAIPDILSGSCGLLVERNAESIRTAIELLILDEERRLMFAKNARAKVLSCYNLTVVAEQYARYWKLCNKRYSQD